MNYGDYKGSKFAQNGIKMCIYLKQFVGVTKHISYEGDMRGEFRILAGIRGGGL